GPRVRPSSFSTDVGVKVPPGGADLGQRPEPRCKGKLVARRGRKAPGLLRGSRPSCHHGSCRRLSAATGTRPNRHLQGGDTCCGSSASVFTTGRRGSPSSSCSSSF